MRCAPRRPEGCITNHDRVIVSLTTRLFSPSERAGWTTLRNDILLSPPHLAARTGLVSDFSIFSKFFE